MCMPVSPGHNQPLPLVSAQESISAYSVYSYIYGKFQDPLLVRYSAFVTTTLCTGSSCLVFRFHPVLSLSLFLPSFLSNCLISLSFLFFPLILSNFLSNFAIPLCFHSFSSSFFMFLFLGYNFAPPTRFQHLLSWFIIHLLRLVLCMVQSEMRSLIHT